MKSKWVKRDPNTTEEGLFVCLFVCFFVSCSAKLQANTHRTTQSYFIPIRSIQISFLSYFNSFDPFTKK